MIDSDGRSENAVPGDAGERAVLLATKCSCSRPSGASSFSGPPCWMRFRRDYAANCALLSAPAGWGKTTLVAQWVLRADKDQRFGWLSLDSSDNDPVWFWMYVIAALQNVSPGIGTRALELLRDGRRPSAGRSTKPVE